MHTFAVILAISTVLGCPFGCLFNSSSHVEANSPAVSCCGHCGSHPLPQEDHQPDRDGGPAKTCSCQGAILGQVSVELDPLVAIPLLEVAVPLTMGAPVTALAIDAREASFARPYGDTLRIAIGSLVR